MATDFFSMTVSPSARELAEQSVIKVKAEVEAAVKEIEGAKLITPEVFQ